MTGRWNLGQRDDRIIAVEAVVRGNTAPSGRYIQSR
jgi:hypothetical protein